MSDLRTLLENAAGPAPAPIAFDDVLDRVRQRRRRMAAGVAGATAVLAAAILIPLLRTAGPDVRVRPAERGEEVPATTLPTNEGQSRPTTPHNTSVTARRSPGAPAAAPRQAESVSSYSGRFAFTRSGDVYVAKWDGSGEARVARRAHSPTFSPDGKRLAVIMLVGPEPARGHLAVMDINGANVRVIRNASGPNNGFSVDLPAWSPDGSAIAFVQRYCGSSALRSGSARTGDDACRPPDQRTEDFDGAHWSEIRSIRPDGSGDRPISGESNSYSESPSWSPLSTRIAFARALNAPDPDWDLYVVNADGSSPVNITPQPATDSYDPAWSPDGSWIAFSFSSAAHATPTHCGRRTAGLSLITPDGSVHPQLTDGDEGCDSEPAWGPDGRWLAFTRKLDENGHVGEVWATRVDVASPERAYPRRVTAGAEPALAP